MKKVFIILLLFCFAFSLSAAEPNWFENPPKKSGFFFFAGVGKGKKRRSAKEGALADVFSQIVYMVNASISANSTFEQYVEENEEDARRESSVYKKVRAKGDAVIENFELVKQVVDKERTSKGKKRYVFYALAKIPKSEIAKARKRIEEEREKRRKNAMGVFSVAVFPNGDVEEVDTIKSELQSLYKQMGFNIKSVALDIDAKVARSKAKMVKFLKNEAYPGIKKALVCVIKPSRIRKERTGSRKQFKITSVLGDLIVTEIDLATGEILASNTFSSKGVSMRKGNDAAEDAFRKLIKNLTKELVEEPGSKDKDDDLF